MKTNLLNRVKTFFKKLIRSNPATFKKGKIPGTLTDCTASTPIPKLPGCDICIATEFFEHVHDPMKYFDEMHSALRNNGLLITNVANHKKEFMHVTPNLQSLRNKIQELNYEIFKKDKILRKTS